MFKNIVSILISNNYHYFPDYYLKRNLLIPVKYSSYKLFIKDIIPSILKIFFYLKKYILKKFLIFLDKDLTSLVFKKKLIRFGLFRVSNCFRNSILHSSISNNLKYLIIIGSLKSDLFFYTALKKNINIIFVSNIFSNFLYKPFIFLRSNISNEKTVNHFIRQIYYLKKFSFFKNNCFFNRDNVRYFLFTDFSKSKLFVLALQFNEYLYFNRSYIEYSINKLLNFFSKSFFNYFVFKKLLINKLLKLRSLYNEGFFILFFKLISFRNINVQFYCHSGKYTCFCLYKNYNSSIVKKISMHFIAFKDVIDCYFLNKPFLFDNKIPISKLVLSSNFYKSFFLK